MQNKSIGMPSRENQIQELKTKDQDINLRQIPFNPKFNHRNKTLYLPITRSIKRHSKDQYGVIALVKRHNRPLKTPLLDP